MKIEMKNLDRQQSHDLIANSIAPLPVALISTIGQDGTHNAAPFSFITPICSKPPVICVYISMRQGEKKDTLRNIEFSHDFVVNAVDEAMVKQAIQADAAYPSSVDEIKEVGLTALNSEKVKSPRIAESKVSFECRLVQKLEILEELREGQGLRAIVFGEVILAHIRDELYVEGKVEPSLLRAVGRVGKEAYCRTSDVFMVKSP